MPIPRFLTAELAGHIDGKQPDDLVFAGIRNGQPLRVSTFRTAFSAAASTIGVPDLLRTPDRIRTGATALRGRRARPLHNGGLAVPMSLEGPMNSERKPSEAGFSHKIAVRRTAISLGYQDSNLD